MTERKIDFMVYPNLMDDKIPVLGPLENKEERTLKAFEPDTVTETFSGQTVFSMLTKSMRNAYEAVDNNIKKLSVETLERLILRDVENPLTLTDKRLKKSFWGEYNAKIGSSGKITPYNVWKGVSSEAYWNKLLVNPKKMAWLILAPPSYDDAINECLEFGFQKIGEIINLNVMKQDGEANVPLINAIIKAVNMLDLRKHGAITQRIEQKTYSVNAQLPDGTNVPGKVTRSEALQIEEKPLDEMSHIELDKKLQKLDKSSSPYRDRELDVTSE